MRGLRLAWSVHSSMSSLLGRYDGFILDQFGVLHNGREAFPKAIDCVNALVANDKGIVILSNTSASSKSCLNKLSKLGFHNIDSAVTSGEEASHYIRSTYGAGETTKRAIWFTYKEDTQDKLTLPPLEFLDQCGNIALCDSVEEADFVIVHGSQVWRQTNNKELSIGSFMQDGSFSIVGPLLQASAARTLPMVCANPDFRVKMANGDFAFMPGTLAKYYKEQCDGHVVSFGKPQVEHFQACIRELNMPAHRIVHVGDSLHHDIAGANSAGIDSIFVTSAGVHSNFLEIDFGGVATIEKLTELFEMEGITPTHVISSFQL